MNGMKAFAVACLSFAAMLAACGEEIDRIDLGDAASERAHSFADGGASYAETGATLRVCRRLRKPSAEQWRSQPMKFRLKTAEKGWTYKTSLEEGLKKTYKWYLDNYKKFN